MTGHNEGATKKSGGGKGVYGEGMKRLHDLVRFLTERGERGASLKEIMKCVYYPDYGDYGADEKVSEADSKKFRRDCASLRELYIGSTDEGDFSDAEHEITVKCIRAAPENRYVLKSKYTFMLPMVLRDEQLQVLVAGINLGRHFLKPLEQAAGEIWDKLKRQFPPAMLEKGERLGKAIALELPVSAMDRDPELFQKIIQAIDEKKVLKIRQYEDRDGKIGAYCLSPYKLYFRYHAWYVMGGCPERSKDYPVPFRLSRMSAVELLSNGTFIPCPYSLKELEENIALDFHPADPDKIYDIRLRISGTFAKPAAQTEWFPGQKITWEKDQKSLIYEVRLKGLEAVCLWIMRALDCMEVLGPSELRQEIDRRVKAYLDRASNIKEA